MRQGSSVGVVDKTVELLRTVGEGPASLAEIVVRTGLSRATAHRLAVALETHRFLVRDDAGRFAIGPAVVELAAAGGADGLEARSRDVLERLCAATGESAQLYRRAGSVRRCVAAAERASGLRDTVPVGAVLPMTAGSAAQVLLAWESAESVAAILPQARFTAATLGTVRRRGWAASVAERESGVASVSAPVFGAAGDVVAAVSVSGPIDRLTRMPGRLHADAVVAAAEALSSPAAVSG